MATLRSRRRRKFRQAAKAREDEKVKVLVKFMGGRPISLPPLSTSTKIGGRVDTDRFNPLVFQSQNMHDLADPTVNDGEGETLSTLVTNAHPWPSQWSYYSDRGIAPVNAFLSNDGAILNPTTTVGQAVEAGLLTKDPLTDEVKVQVIRTSLPVDTGDTPSSQSLFEAEKTRFLYARARSVLDRLELEAAAAETMEMANTLADPAVEMSDDERERLRAEVEATILAIQEELFESPNPQHVQAFGTQIVDPNYLGPLERHQYRGGERRLDQLEKLADELGEAYDEWRRAAASPVRYGAVGRGPNPTASRNLRRFVDEYERFEERAEREAREEREADQHRERRQQNDGY